MGGWAARQHASDELGAGWRDPFAQRGRQTILRFESAGERHGGRARQYWRCSTARMVVQWVGRDVVEGGASKYLTSLTRFTIKVLEQITLVLLQSYTIRVEPIVAARTSRQHLNSQNGGPGQESAHFSHPSINRSS